MVPKREEHGTAPIKGGHRSRGGLGERGDANGGGGETQHQRGCQEREGVGEG